MLRKPGIGWICPRLYIRRCSAGLFLRIQAFCPVKDPVQPDILQQAVDIAMKRFPTYHSAMRKGFFWRYLEPNTRPGPFVKPDIRNFCMPMPFKSNNRYLVRFYWYDRRISLEAHHSLGDGTGGMYLLQTVTAVYLRLLGHEISNGGFVLDVNETPDPEEFEDAICAMQRPRLPAKTRRKNLPCTRHARTFLYPQRD